MALSVEDVNDASALAENLKTVAGKANATVQKAAALAAMFNESENETDKETLLVSSDRLPLKEAESFLAQWASYKRPE